jgi:hypothetical protein
LNVSLVNVPKKNWIDLRSLEKTGDCVTVEPFMHLD